MNNWTEEELRRWQGEHPGATSVQPVVPTALPPAIGRLPKPKQNKTERAYDDYLALQLRMGLILWYGFEAITIKLGPDLRLTPDFLVMLPDGRLELHDTKGPKKITSGRNAGKTKPYVEEDALVKAKVTAAHYVIPIFFVWRESNGEWSKKGF